MNQTVGIIGGGQLGQMLSLAAPALGLKIIVIDPTPNCPAYQVGAEQITADLQDPKAISELAARSDVLSIEIEHLNADALAELEKDGKPVHPSAGIIKLIQDKLSQNQWLKKAGLPIADFQVVNTRPDLERALKQYEKLVLKSRFGGYDGRGNAVVSSSADIDAALKKLGSTGLYAESFIKFKKELAVMVARNPRGDIKTYPVVETVHRRNICELVLAPADVKPAVVLQAQEIAKRAVAELKGVGVFGVEMFLTADDGVLINEIAPRVHNSGHYTIEACETSQFEQHLRAITGKPLGQTGLKVGAAAMVNILGERDGPVELVGADEVESMENVYLHLYGKSPTKVDRKMGHITATADTIKAARKLAELARSKISI